MCYLHPYLGLCFHHLTRKGLFCAPSFCLSFHLPQLHQAAPPASCETVAWRSSQHGEILHMPSPAGVFPGGTYPAWSWVGGDRMICQPT